MHRLWLNPTLLLRLGPPLLRLLSPTSGLLGLPQRVALLLRPTPANRGLRLHGARLWHGGGLRRLRRPRLLTHRCTHGRRPNRAGEGRSHFSRLAAREFFHRDLPVSIHVGCGMKACGLFQVGAGGFRQFFDGQATGIISVGREEALFIAHGFRFRFLHRCRSWLGGHHGAKRTRKGIGRGLVLPTVVKVGQHGHRSWSGIVWYAGEGDA